MAKLQLSLAAGAEKFTVLFSARYWRDVEPAAYTEYVWAPKDDESKALQEAIKHAAVREAKLHNKDLLMVKQFMNQSKKLMAIADGFVSMTGSRKIQKRVGS